jgi:branched-chain amino acid transport system substrate-binding protein
MKRKILIPLAILVVIIAAIAIYFTQKPKEPETIKIGAILPLTGPGAIFAQYIKEGADLAAEQLNKTPSVPINIFYEDSKNQPKEGISAYNKLIASEKPAVVIVALSSVAKALAPLAEQKKIIQIYIAVAISNITDGKYRFRIYPEALGMAGVMARYNATKLKAKTSAVIYINDDFGRASLEAYSKEFEAHGGKVIFSDSYELQQTDFRSLITKLKNIRPAPDVIYLNGYGPSYGIFVKQLKEFGIKSQLTADMTMGLPNTLEQVGNAAEGTYFVDGKMSSEFIEIFKRKYGKEPTSYSGYAYDIVNILAKIAKEEKKFTPEIIAQGLLRIKDYNGAMGNITIQPNGDSNLEFVVKQIKNGQAVLIQ